MLCIKALLRRYVASIVKAPQLPEQRVRTLRTCEGAIKALLRHHFTSIIEAPQVPEQRAH
jgi:hypothetical protein